MSLYRRIRGEMSLVGCLSILGCGRTELALDIERPVQCDAQCQACGNSLLDFHEQCDDGNALNGDGCSSHCRWEPVSIACGYAHTCAIGANGKLLCWGLNENGQLGQGDRETRGDDPDDLGPQLHPIELGTAAGTLAIAASGATCALLSDDSLKCWGNNKFGQLGVGDTNHRGDEPGEMGEALRPVDLGTGAFVRSVAAAGLVTCAVLDNGGVKCWGGNGLGQLGTGDSSELGVLSSQMGNNLSYLDLGTGRSVRHLAMSRRGAFICAILDDDALKCWGDGEFGALGLGDRENRGDDPGEMGDNLPSVSLGTGEIPVALGLGGAHSCAILQGGAVKCWGNNPYGELGLGDHRSRGGAPGDMGDALPFVNLGSGRRAISLAAGLYSTCALLDDGHVKCWGQNLAAQLGLGDNRARGERPTEMGDNLKAVDLGKDRRARAICAGNHHACVLLDNGTIKCWGQNSAGQAGIGTDGMDLQLRYGPLSNLGDAPEEMGDNLAAVDLRF